MDSEWFVTALTGGLALFGALLSTDREIVVKPVLRLFLQLSAGLNLALAIATAGNILSRLLA